MTEPISPKDVASEKAARFPSYVFEAFNELIAEKYTEGSARITLEDATDRVLQKSPGLPREDLFKLGYLNVEEVYRSHGWDVDFHKAYSYLNDMGPSYFTFIG